ncbi:MAG: VOC family protein [Saprospiraceae bacterium]|nr:MAG: VOC family protein [Saprospiraceae bacterium]
MTKVNPYLTFLGNCEEAFNYYKSIFGGEFTYVGRFSEMPDDPNYSISEKDKNKIMHISLPLSKETTLMGSDTGGEGAAKTEVGNNISLSITASSKADADRFFAALSKGGKATMPMNKTFWGDYFGMCTDQFDINWMISFNENAPQ